MRKRAILLAVICVVIYDIHLLSATDWESDAPLQNPLKMIGRTLLRKGSSLPGIRLMYGGEKGFPLKDLTLWDSLFGCLSYGLAFLFVLWVTTPLPDISVHHFLLVNFMSRDPDQDEADEDAMEVEIPRWHPGGGEGPIFQIPQHFR